MRDKRNKANVLKVVKTVLTCLILLLITVLVNIALPTLVIKVSHIATVLFILSVVGMVLKTIPVIKEMWRNYCDETDREAMKALLGVTMASEYGIDIHDQRYLKHGDPLKILLNDVNWPKKFKQYKYQFGVAPKSDKAGVDTYALLHQLT